MTAPPFDALASGLDPEGSEQAEVRALVRTIVARHATPERIREYDERRAFDHDLYAALAGSGLVALDATEDGTHGGDVRDQVVVIEELAAGPTAMAVCFIVQYMGVQLLTAVGSVRQRAEVLRPLLAGESRIAFAMTEPDGGTDVARVMRTRASHTDAGHWVLNGAKMWISGPLIARHAIVVARTDPPQPSAVDGITLFLVPLDAPGVSVRELDTVAIHGLDTCEVRFDRVRLPDDAVLGERGRGFRQVLATLNRERLGAAAAALGIARGAFECSLRYARERKAFGRPIGAFQVLQHRLVDGAVAIESARGLLTRAAAAEARGERADLLSAMAKLAASEAATRIVDDGMRMMGGSGLSLEYPMQRYFRDARLYTFAPLSNEMLRNYLGERMLGLPRSF